MLTSPARARGAQVVRHVGDAQPDLAGDLLDGPLALREHVDDLCPPPGPQRAGHLCEHREQSILRRSISQGPMLVRD
ncbi:MAG: hypothetical protein L0H84_07865 [Pseudonocardia sp.]|nr:hypothetical protein [Pseudonocardia sp.]